MRVGQSFRAYGIHGDFKSSIQHFDAKIGSFMGIKYTLFFQILVFRVNLSGNFGYNGFLFSGILVCH